jgi:hypothetical protein
MIESMSLSGSRISGPSDDACCGAASVQADPYLKNDSTPQRCCTVRFRTGDRLSRKLASRRTLRRKVRSSAV